MIGPDATISVALLISVASIVCTMINTVAGGKKRQEEQYAKENNRQLEVEKNFVKLNIKLDDMAEVSTNLMEANAEKADQLRNVTEKLILVSERVETLFRYKDNHEERITALEKNYRGE